MIKLSEDGKWWIDKNNNRWDTHQYTSDQAEYFSNTLTHCTDCINCNTASTARIVRPVLAVTTAADVGSVYIAKNAVAA